MCGISGIINFNESEVNKADIKSMMIKMKHRGPDDEGIFIDNNVGFGFVRLSILDLSIAGHQPMFSNDERFVIVFNGEIFNYLELKIELQNDFQFKTKTDTEVILAAYQKWGEKCLDRFNGMFSFVIFDRETRKIFGARDRYGIKPFYYYCTDDKFIFASEIKSILPLIKAEANDKAIYDYLIYNRTDHTEDTFFQGISKLNHGHYFIIEDGIPEFKKWYDLKSKISTKLITPSEYRELFKDSLKLRLRSDVPVGVCLSGGLDSSAITSSLVKDFGLNDLNTFSAVFSKGEPTSEERFIDNYIPIIKNMYKTYPSADSFFDDYTNFIYVHTEPVTDTGPYIQYKVMQLAKDHVTVTLDGQGADEQLGGYHNFFGSYYLELFKEMKFLKFISENIYYYKNHRSLSALAYFTAFYMPGKGRKLDKAKSLSSINNDFINTNNSNTDIIHSLYNPSTLTDSLIQHFEYKLEHLLRWEDLNGMNFSIESRVPFLDYRLVESTLSLPSSSIIQKGMTKHILRESMKDILPEMIYNRKDKKGFSSPRDKWFRTEKFQVLIRDIINSDSFKNRGYFDAKLANKRYDQHLSNEIDISTEIWKWINLETWFKTFID